VNENRRTQFLLIAMSVIAVIWLGDMGYRNFVEQPRQQREREYSRLEGQLNDAQEIIINSADVSDELAALEQISLPYDTELARAAYQGWLLGLVQEVGLTGASVDASAPMPVTIQDRDSRRQKEIFVRYSFSLRGRGNLQQVAQWMYRFYQGGHLHKIQSMTLNPSSGGQTIDFGATIEAISLTRVERKGELSGKRLARLASVDFDDYLSIPRRNLFARHGDTALSKVILSAITIGSDGVFQAWFSDGKGETTVLGRGESMEIDSHSLQVIDVLVGQVLLEVDGRVVTLRPGQPVQRPTAEES